MKTKTTLIFLLLYLSIFTCLKSDENAYFNDGKKLFDQKKFQEAKFKFEQDIVYNPKSEKAYLYLAKIFNQQNKIEMQENNLSTVILLNPTNEDAIYDLVLLNIKKSNFSEARKLIENFNKVCKKNCENKKILNKKLKESLEAKE